MTCLLKHPIFLRTHAHIWRNGARISSLIHTESGSRARSYFWSIEGYRCYVIKKTFYEFPAREEDPFHVTPNRAYAHTRSGTHIELFTLIKGCTISCSAYSFNFERQSEFLRWSPPITCPVIYSRRSPTAQERKTFYTPCLVAEGGVATKRKAYFSTMAQIFRRKHLSFLLDENQDCEYCV